MAEEIMFLTSEKAHIKIRLILNDRGIKISWLAKKLGLSQPHFSMMLSGDRPIPEDILARVQTLLECKL